MAMRKSIIWMAFGAIAALTVLAGCQKVVEEDVQVSSEPGTEIVFGASTDWENEPGTRTEYSGKDQNNNAINKSTSEYERIDWVDWKDQIRILCDAAEPKVSGAEHAATYTVSGVQVDQSDKKKSRASIVSADDNSLHWGTGKHYFYALYPAPGMESNYAFTDKTVLAANSKIESVTGSKAKITGVVPGTQNAVRVGNIYKANMNYAYMYASTQATPGQSGRVLLSFNPLVTTLEFSLKRMASDPVTANLTRLELSSASTPLTGTFVATVDGTGSTPSVSISAPSYSAGTNDKITVTLPAPGVQLSDTEVQFTFLTLPVNQQDLTLTLYFGSDYGTKRTLRLNTTSGPVTVPACKKAYFHFGVPGTIPYTLEVVGPENVVSSTGGEAPYQVKSYKQGNAGNTGVGWTAEFSTDGGLTWGPKPSWLTAFTARDDDGSVPFKDYTATLAENLDPVGTPKVWKGGTTVIGSESQPINLALRNIYGQWTGNNGAVVSSIADAKLNTANCYVVSDPGWYCFPCIYGNAYKNDNDYPAAYTSSATSGTSSFALQRFVNHAGNGITNGWIQNNEGMGAILSDDSQVSVKLLWQDKQDLIDVSKLGHFLEELDAPNSHSNRGRYIKFYIDPSQIYQGNAVIALCLNDVIVWSWHIWVIEKEKLATKTVYPGSSSIVNPVEMMVTNLGWYDSDLVTQPREVKVRITQDISGNTGEFTIIQDQPLLHGGNVYYNWGRKDPMLGMNADFTQKVQFSPDNATKWQIVEADTGDWTIQHAIQHPYYFYKTMQAPHKGSWTDSFYDNLWNTNSATMYDADVAVVKSIYDPCPVGFKVPNRNAFFGFSVDTILGKWNQGWTFKTSPTDTEGIFFPATFLRDFDSGLIDDWRRYGKDFGESMGYLEGYIGGYYWGAATSHHDYPNWWGGIYLEIRDHSNLSTTPYIIPNTTAGPAGYGFSVRPVKE